MAQTTTDWAHQLLKNHEFTSNGTVLPKPTSHLQGLLAKNHRYSMIHGEYRANHMIHHLYSLLVLEAIIDDNWEAHIGKHATYSDYLDYFDHKVKTLGFLTTDLSQYGTVHKRLHRLLESPENTEVKAPINAWNISTSEDARLESVRRLMRAITLEYAGQHHMTQPGFFIVHPVTSMFATQTLVPLLQPSNQERLLRVQLYYAILVCFAQGRETFSQEVLDKYELLARFQVLNQAHLDQAVHQEAAGNGDIHAAKAVRALQAFTMLDPGFRPTYTKAATMALDRIRD
ncbi:hypothetical protein H4R35_004996 [Dimargaris xerosporica]|nr:hypothetical protein H4R35_004996 [Dimargaris xerosporica]